MVLFRMFTTREVVEVVDTRGVSRAFHRGKVGAFWTLSRRQAQDG